MWPLRTGLYAYVESASVGLGLGWERGRCRCCCLASAGSQQQGSGKSNPILPAFLIFQTQFFAFLLSWDVSPTMDDVVPSLSSREKQSLKLSRNRQNSVQCGKLGVELWGSWDYEDTAQSESSDNKVMGTNVECQGRNGKGL